MAESFDVSDAVTLSSPVTMHGMVVGQVLPLKTSKSNSGVKYFSSVPSFLPTFLVSSALSTLFTILYTICHMLDQLFRANNVNFRDVTFIP